MTVALTYSQELLTCLETSLTAQAAAVPVAPVPQYISLRAGGDVAPMLSRVEDECCGGVAWVRVMESTPRFTPDDEAGKCVGSLRRTVLEMGVVRCAPTPGPDAIITSEQWTNLAIALESDHSAMESALCCLLTEIAASPAILGDPDVYPSTYTPFGPDANCIGATMQLIIEHGCACGSGG